MHYYCILNYIFTAFQGVGISVLIKKQSDPAGKDFAVKVQFTFDVKSTSAKDVEPN